MDDELYFSVRPMLATAPGGRLVTLSTPFGARGWWHREWTEGEGWERYRVRAHDCPRITPAFLEEEKRTIPANWFDAEYNCQFTDTVTQVFASDLIAQAINYELDPLFPDLLHAGGTQ